MASRRASTASRPLLPALPLAERVCLALVVEGVAHGWAIGTALAPDGDIGRIWSLSRALTYRAIEQLTGHRLLVRAERPAARHTGIPAAGGARRLTLTPTAAGRRHSAAWLDEPVTHLRDVRVDLLLKLALRARAGLDNADLLRRQLVVLGPTIDVLTRRDPTGDPVDVWRREHARAVRRFLEESMDPFAPVGGHAGIDPGGGHVGGGHLGGGHLGGGHLGGEHVGGEHLGGVRNARESRSELRLSARNQIRARVVTVKRGELMASVKAVLGDGQPLTATITQEAADDLDVAPGDDVVLVVKATEVMVAKP